MEELLNIFFTAYKIMFKEKQPPKDFKISKMMNNTLTKVETDLSGEASDFHLTFLEQNPNKNSVYGKRAKKGSKIMWIIAYRNKRETWIGRIENEVWIPSKKRKF